MGFIIRFKDAPSPLTAIVAADGMRPARMPPPCAGPASWIFIILLHLYHCVYIQVQLCFDQQELLIRLSLILVFSFRNAGTKKIRGTASRYPALDITLNFYKWPYFCESLLSSLTKCICNFQQSSC
jgi:hypothetical protein